MAAGEGPASEAHEYFLVIEELFIRLRGAPLLLSPADWQLANEWYRTGIPLEVVCDAVQEVFARRRERRAKGPVQGLRYCRRAVEAAWEERLELTGGSARPLAADLDVAGRLRDLAAALPESLAERKHFGERILALEGEAERVERQLSALDEELLEKASRQLDPALREGIEQRVEAALLRLEGRVPPGEIDDLRARLARREIRRALGLPLLSLFAPDSAAG